MNKVNVYAIGKNFDNMFGVKSEFLTELTPILSGVKTLVMGLGTTFAIKYDNSLHYMGDPSYRRNFSLSVNVFPKNVKNVLVTENYLGLVLTLDGVLYHTGDESLYKVMDKVRKIHHVPETDDFLIERDDGMFLITAESMLNTKGVNVQMKFKTYRDLGEEMIYNIEILIEGEYQRTLNYFTYDYIITNDNRLYNIKYDLKIANSVLSFERPDYTEVNAVIWSSTDGYFNKSMIIDDGHTIPHLKNIFSIKFESPIIKMSTLNSFCILLLENGNLLLGGNIPKELQPLVPINVPISDVERGLEYAVTNAIAVLDDVRDFHHEWASYLAIVKNV